ncbi:N-acetylmuramoyl-L-alanine amidase [Akkermansiaceae bacterium]|nr:N-acetylmuramoyl-L-alanine amidase [Akkermansiaceae bacterium]
MSEGKGTTTIQTSFRIVVIFPLVLIAAALTFFFWPNPETPAPSVALPEPQKEEPHALAPLGITPNWTMLDVFQKTITQDQFLTRLERVYSKNNGWEQWIATNKRNAMIKAGGETYLLEFAQTPKRAPGALFPWKKKSELPASTTHPLTGLHIALDPGHIGGDFAEMEERHLSYGDHGPIQEGTMTLLTAQHLRNHLERLGANVTLVRKDNTPVTSVRPENFKDRDRRSAEKLFYRTAEIRARAELVNEVIQPDLVICLHYNASGSPIALSGQDFHIILNGAYHETEIAREDERFEMLQHLLAGTIEEELPLAGKMAEVFMANTDLPPYEYRPDHPYSTKLGNAVWARNLLANRLYQCPVIFMEPYTMNSTEFIARHKAGDYEGLRMIDGKMRLSVYREYAQAVADGLVAYYGERQPLLHE